MSFKIKEVGIVLIPIITSIILFILSKNFLISITFTTFLLALYFYYQHKIISLLKYKEVYKLLSKITIHYTDITTLLEFLSDSISKILNAERTIVYIYNSETDILWAFIDFDDQPKKFYLKIGEGIAGYVAQTKKFVNIKYDAYQDKRFLPLFDQKTGFRTKTVLASPTYDLKGNLIGVVEVLNRKYLKNFTKEDEDILQLFCKELAIVLNNSQLYEETKLLFESLLKAFATAVDARDPATKGHSLRVLKYSLNIAKELNLNEKEIEILKYASILHDVGKIGIPDEILLKNGKFTKEEYEIMKKHVQITEEILSQIHFPKEYQDVIFIAKTHHEFLDGSGYTYGLKNEQIPLLSRILCIADIFDALISYDRPYKPPFTLEKSISILQEMANEGKLDKEIVELFISKKLYQIEKREFVRINKEISFSYRKLGPEDIKSVITKTKNISAKGLQFVSKEEITPDTFIEIELYLPNHTIKVIAKTVHCVKNNGYYEIGINFVNLPYETKIFLSQYLNFLKEKV
ncbi:MAG: HD domain-containing phosphohydrolase [Endomicrobiia bacterium]